MNDAVGWIMGWNEFMGGLRRMGTGNGRHITSGPTHKLTNKAPCWLVSELVHGFTTTLATHLRGKFVGGSNVLAET